jgi:hypothetical protein
MYLFDNGVANALCRRLRFPVNPTLKGRLFEQFIIRETGRRLDYNGAKVDFLIELDGQLKAAVEFKSRESVSKTDITGFASFHEDDP